MPNSQTQNLSSLEQSLNWIGDKLLDIRNYAEIDFGTQKFLDGLNITENYKIIYEKLTAETGNYEWSVKLASQTGAIVQSYTGPALYYTVGRFTEGLSGIFGDSVTKGMDLFMGNVDQNNSLLAAYARVGEVAGNEVASGINKVLEFLESKGWNDTSSKEDILISTSAPDSSSPKSIIITKTTNPSTNKDSITISSNNYSQSELLDASKNLLGQQAIGSNLNLESNNGALSATLLSADSLQNFLSKYNFNQTISDYAGIIPSLIVSDGNGGNFNLLALPNFSDLFGQERVTAWDNFTNSFLETALSPFNYDLDQFTGFLNQNRITFSEFESDLNGAAAGDSGSFSSAFDSYFNDAFLSNAGLDSDLFTITVNKIDGEGEVRGDIAASDKDFEDYEQPIPDPDLIPIEEIFTFSAEDYWDMANGTNSYFDRFANMDDFEDNLNRIQEDYFALQNNLFADLNYEQRGFVEEFNDALQQLIAENPASWQDLFTDFSDEWDREWGGRMSNLISIHESEMFATLDDYQKIYYSPSTVEAVAVSGSLKSEFDDGEVEWDFDPVIYEDGYIEGFGYYEMINAFYIDDTEYPEYWSYLDNNCDDLISEEEFDEDWELFYELFGNDESFNNSISAFDYEAEEFSEYWVQFDSNEDGLISEDEFEEDWDSFVTYLEDAGYYEQKYAFDVWSNEYPSYWELFDRNADGLIDENEFSDGEDEDDFSEWYIEEELWGEYYGSPYENDEIEWASEEAFNVDWQEVWMMSDWSPWATPEDAFYRAYAVDFDEYVSFDEESFDDAFNAVANVDFTQYWSYVEDYYDMSEYWDLEVEVKITGFETDYSAAFFDQFASFNSWKLDTINSWQDNQASLEIGFAPRFELDPFLTYRQAFDEFGFVFQLDDSLYLSAPVNQSMIEELSSEERQFINLSTESFVSSASDAKLISANSVANRITVGAGNDIIESGAGNDIIEAGAGDDMLIGEGGDDVLQGGAGDDIYIFSDNFGNDVISDNDGAIIINNQILAGIANQNEDHFSLGQARLSMVEGNLLISENGQSVLIENFENGKFGIALNHNPDSNFENSNLDEDGVAVFDVVADSSDLDGDELAVASITQPSSGIAEIVEGKIKYVPNANFNGQDSLNYLLSDGRGGFVGKTLNIQINSVNDTPVINYSIGNLNVNEDSPLTINLLTGATDADGDVLTATLQSNPQHGTLTQNPDGTYQYQPNANYFGADSFNYEISDGNGGVISKTLTLQIASVNDAPVITSTISTSNINEDAVNVVISTSIIASSFSDIDGDSLTYSASLSNGNPLPSWLSINSATGEILSTNPSNSAVGNYDIRIIATDPSNASISQNFVVTVNNVNDAPTVQTVATSTTEDTNQLILPFSGSDIDVGDSLTYAILTNPTQGAVVNNGNGTFGFNLGNSFQSLAAGQTQDITFTYQATDSSGAQSNISTATITITGTNDAPTASITTATTNEDNVVTIDVLSGAHDIDGDTLTISTITNGTHGIASLTTDINGKQIISYTPTTNYNGTDKITYSISDGNGGVVTKDLTVTVNSVNDAPIVGAVIGSQSAKAGNSFAYIIPTTAFTDVDNSSLSYSAKLSNNSTLPSWLTFDATTKTFSGTPPSGAAAVLSIKVTASDGALSATQTFSLNVATNVINGTAGSDALTGTAGNDVINGGAGNDTIVGGLGADIIDGGAGTDTISYADSTSAVKINLLTNVNSGGSAAGDRLTNIENIIGSSFNDTITGSSSSNYINGGAGNDTIVGGLGADVINGGAGKDSLWGNNGKDNLKGGAGADYLVGGGGNDTFIYENLTDSTNQNSDLILDFIHGQDKIDLSALGIDSIDDLSFRFEGNQTIIDDLNSDFLIKLNQQIQMAEQDFIFS
jgi:VCBS repeat-containing protein